MNDKKEPQWTLAAVAALAAGDLENALIAATPGGIEAQEAQGQRDFVGSETLPFKPGGYRDSESSLRQQLESLGIEFLEQVDDLFWCVRLPPGWKKVPTDHSMWSKLIDDQGRERASIFYKAAFYDRSAHISLTRRYSYTCMPVDGWDTFGPGTRYHGVVTDMDEIIWSTEPTEPEPEKPERGWWDAKDGFGEQAKDWLDAHYPDWRDPLAYWD